MLTDKPAKVVKSVVTKEQFDQLVAQMNDVQNENRQIKQFVRHQLPSLQNRQKYNSDQTASSGTQSNQTKPIHHHQTTSNPTINKIEAIDSDEESPIIPPGILSLLEQDECSDDLPNTTTANVNVVLTTDATMASEFKLGVGKQTKTGLFDSGVSHSCMSYDCYLSTVPGTVLYEAPHISVKNASGKSMGPVGVCCTSITIGSKSFTHSFIVCHNLTSALILGIDFSSLNRIGTDWTSDGRMYLHQGNKKLIEGTISAVSVQQPRLVMKMHVVMPPHTIGIVPVKPSQPDFIKKDKVYESTPDPLFESQNSVGTIPLIHHVTNDNGLVVCVINPNDWPVTLHENKTVQGVREVFGTAHINKALLTDDKSVTTAETPHKNVESAVIMPGDQSPHQKLKLEDYIVKPETKRQLDKLIVKYDSIVSKHDSDIDTTPLIKMDIETEGPPIASCPYVLPLKQQEFVCRNIEKLEKAGIIRKSLSPYASPIVVVPKKVPPGAPLEDQYRMAIDYCRLNKQMPFIKGIDSNSKGAVSLIPLPKIDELFARLSSIFSAIDL